jgi:transcriptional regulator with GAF, ATPase, and Fis domain
VVILVGRPSDRFTDRHRQLAAALLDPFSAALANDHQLRELTCLREAAEAQSRRLLTKLGRERAEDTIVGSDSGLRAVMDRIGLVVGSDVPVLIFGETGTGKELVARTIHSRSPRSQGPVIRVNCGAIPPELIDSELFGHERGAFTGAGESRRGWFERAHGGTLFLDEIGELPPAVQVRLLRVLQDGCLQRVGGEKLLHVDVRIVAATHRDLSAMVAEGTFREDLWYRIAVFPIVLPPLRERLDDISDLAAHFARRAAVRFGLAEVAPSEEDLQLLRNYPWPGNVRELGTVIDRAAILGDGRTLEIAAALGVSPLSLPRSPVNDAAAPIAAARTLPLDEVILRHIEAALQRTAGRVEGPYGAARLLNINPNTLRSKMRKLRIDGRRFRQIDP